MRKRLSPATAIACVALFFSLTGAGLAASRYVAAPQAQRPAAATGGLRARRAAGALGANRLVVVDGLGRFVASGATVTVDARCPAGTSVVSGGWAGPLQQTDIDYNEPDGSRRWEVVATNESPIEGAIQAVAVCAS